VRLAALRGTAFEARSLVAALDSGDAPRSGDVVVSGMLAEQLARQLGVDANPGAVRVGDDVRGGATAALVRVIAGDPSADDVALVRSADAEGVPVVLVQLWPQADWTPPFVLTPFVIECRAGEGFPVDEIAARIVDAVEHPDELSARVPVLRPCVEANAVRESVLRAGFLGLMGARRGASRPLITLEQARLTARLRATSPGTAGEGVSPVLAGTIGVLFASGLVFRTLARSLHGTLPAPVVNAAVAAGGTWVLGEAVRRLESRLSGD
jgi:hypothetical protein